MELQGKLYRSIDENAELKPITAKQLSKQTGISLTDIENAEDLGIITPMKNSRRKLYGEDEIRIVECWAKIIETGFTPELGFDFGLALIYKNALRKLAEEEGKLIAQKLTGKMDIDDIAGMIEKITPVVNILLGIFHKKEIENTTKWYALQYKENEKIPDGKEKKNI